MVLRRFADNGKHLMATPRHGGRRVPMSVDKACAETEFYRMEVEPQYQDEFPPEKVESLLSYFEEKAEGVIKSLLNGKFALTEPDRFYLTIFVALQAVRGWSFRSDLVGLATTLARLDLEVVATDKHLRTALRRGGSPYDDEAIRALRKEMLTSDWRIVPTGSAAVQLMLYTAIVMIHPVIFLTRRIRVLRFPEPLLVTSDQPIAMWARPKRDMEAAPLGLGTADAIWMPLDRRHALALLRTGHEGIIESTRRRAEQINLAVATSAERWIFQHPRDHPIDVSTLPQPAHWKLEMQSVSRYGDTLRVLNRIVKRAE